MNGNMVPVNSAAEAAQVVKRAIYRFDVPESLRRYGIQQMGLVELNAREEIMAAKRAGNQPLQLAFELARECLREIDKVPVSTGDGTADSVFDNMHPKIRTLLVSAYSELHNPSDVDTTAFLASREMRVG